MFKRTPESSIAVVALSATPNLSTNIRPATNKQVVCNTTGTLSKNFLTQIPVTSKMPGHSGFKSFALKTSGIT